uniref:Insulin-like growth factor-binding protein 2 n=1 Tax=Panthera tigris altaica TaxID=74533 RepID=A0A8C9KZX5_PANTA
MVKALQTRSSFRAPLLCLGWRQNRPGLPGILLGSDGLRSDPGFVVLVFLVRLDLSVCQSWGNAPTPPKSCCETEIDSPCKLLSSTARISVLSISRGSDSCWGARRSRNSTLSWSSLPLSADNGDEHAEGGLVENHVDGTVNLLGGGGSAGRKPLKSGMKELAVFREKVTEQHRQMGKGGKHHLGLDEPKKLRPPASRTDQVLERISTMHLPDERGPLEHLYSLHIPNCDKHGLYNLKQCKMSLNGQRGECWCVNPNTGKLIQGAPTIRGDPECHLFYNEQQEARGVHTQRMQ